MLNNKMLQILTIIFVLLLASGCEKSPTDSDSEITDRYKIIFSSNRDGNYDIYIMNDDGSNIQKLTNSTEDDEYPIFSPDGSKIAYVSGRYDKPYVMNNDGSNPQQLSEYSIYGTPIFSPDGSKILFRSSRGVYSINVDGTDEQRLLQPSSNGVSWSPDGSKIAVSYSSISISGSSYEIYIMNADGSELHQLTYDSTRNTSPIWSPDGSNIAFVSERDGTEEIYSINPDGTNYKQLTNVPGYVFRTPVWSPDGTMIAFTEAETPDGGSKIDIWVVKSDGTEQTKLTNYSGINGDPSWSADGSKIVFSSSRERWDIYLMNKDGTNTQRLTNFQDHYSYICQSPNWSPVPLP
jgi:TolB protein